MPSSGYRTVRSELHRLARRIPHHEDDSQSQVYRQRRSRKRYGVDRYRSHPQAPITSEVDEYFGAPSANGVRDSDALHDPQTQTSSYHTRLESDLSKQSNATLSSEKLTELHRLNVRHEWNAHYGMPQSIVNATAARAISDKNGRIVDVEQERGRDRHGRTTAAGMRNEDGEKYVTYLSPRVSYDRQHRLGEKHISDASTSEVGPHPYREQDIWRDDRGIRHLDGNLRSDLKDTRQTERRNWCIAAAMLLLMLGVVIPIAVVISGREHSPQTRPSSDRSIPNWARRGYLDPSDWYDTLDFNVTFTDAKVGGLYVMGLNDTWDDSTRANENVPALNKKWDDGSMPFRGAIYPKRPSLMNGLSRSTLVLLKRNTSLSSTIRSGFESRLSQKYKLQALTTYAFPFSYWAVTTYAGDPYVPMISFRYLLRGIEWARKHGLRIYLDLHGAPGSQNGWNHSGHQGSIGWLNGMDGDLNAQRTVDIHEQLATFFAQPRYKNIIVMYGLVNEPKMSTLPQDKALEWNTDAIETIRGTGYSGLLVMGDGLLGLDSWHGKMQGYEGLVLDAHQYTIYSLGLLSLNHYDKVNFACGGWTQQSKNSINMASGFGPTMVGEWSQADTDCAMYLNSVGVGSRWDGTLDAADTPGDATTGTITIPQCAADNKSTCSCTKTYADPSTYSSEYKNWLLTFAEAQMDSFE